MCMKLNLFSKFSVLVFSCMIGAFPLKAQQYDCNFANPVIKIDFGDDRIPKDFSFSSLKKNYNRTTKICPDDGEFSFVSYTKDCFLGNWISFYKDHTPGSVNGRMMLVNAALKPAAFFTITMTDLKPNSYYELSTWFVNVCRAGSGCEPTPPEIRIAVFAEGKKLAQFSTGAIAPTGSATWKRFAGNFTTPAVVSGLVVTMEDVTEGGCGNDFAVDDIEVRECTLVKPIQAPVLQPKPIQTPVLQPKPIQAPVLQTKPVQVPAPQPKPIVSSRPPVKNNAVIIPEAKKEVQKKVVVKPPVINKEVAVVKNKPVIKQGGTIEPVTKATAIVVPDIIRKRENPVVEKIETGPSEILIELYDNGEIDGDTVTVYHNNELVVFHAGLALKPVTFKIKIDDQNPHHELVMVADNLGSIPPNTSLMVITTKYKRYEVFISSTEQKNARVLIDLQKE